VSALVTGVFDTAPHRLRVAMVAPPWYELPPTGYGGIEVICAALVDALVARGHDVTLFGAGRRTGTAAEFVSTLPHPQYLRLGESMPTLLHAARVNRLLAEGGFDVIHDHSVSGSLNAPHREAPTVVTVHGPADTELGDFYAALGDSIDLVAISDAQRRRRPGLPWAATVHNALDPDWFAPAACPDGPVLWLARFCADKGPDLAIEACRAAGMPLVLAGKCSEPGEIAYLEQYVRPLLGPDVELVCNADRTTADRLLAQARCLLMPIRWHEPFGMVMIEAMASGKPVVALRRGSVPEVVVDGVTGWIRDEPADLPGALRRVGEIDAAACVAHVRAQFGAALMAQRYEHVYRQAIARARRRRRWAGRVTLLPEPSVVGGP
jgi:glycosyltransferase involved in cell wall biosynthesis